MVTDAKRVLGTEMEGQQSTTHNVITLKLKAGKNEMVMAVTEGEGWKRGWHVVVAYALQSASTIEEETLDRLAAAALGRSHPMKTH